MLEGDLTSSRGALAVWRGDKEPKCARVRTEYVSRDWEFGADEGPLQVAAAQLAGAAIVKRFATYCDDDVETVLVVEEDVAGLRLSDVISALASAGGDVPQGLVAYVGREMVRALATAGDVRLRFDPVDVDVAWSGAVAMRPAVDVRAVDELMWEENALRAIAYRDDPDEPASKLVVLGAVLYEIITGAHPYLPAALDDDDERDDEELATAMVERIEQHAFDDISDRGAMGLLASRLLRGEIERVDDMLDDALAHEPFGAAELAGMLRGLFPGRRERDDVEREDRLQVLPGPKVEPETWAELDADMLGRDTAGYETLDLRDVRRGRAGRDDYEPPYEPSVPPVDPFDDE